MPSDPNARSTLDFVVDRYMGTDGCNFFLGLYEADGDKLRIESPARTRLGCEEQTGGMDQESTFISEFLLTLSPDRR